MRSLESPFSDVLQQLRERVRWYVTGQGLILAVVWLVSLFLVGFVLDYFPVLLGASEMPRSARATWLVLTGIGLAVVLQRWVVSRLGRPLTDESLALLIERSHPEFDESLLTAVQSEVPAGEFGQRMLARTRAYARSRLPQIDLKRVFDFRPLWRPLGALVGLILVGGILAAFVTQPFAVAWKRLFLLDNTPYPRRTLLEVVGFEGRELVVSRGSDVTIRVRADANRPTPPPRLCTIFYRLADGTRGRAAMSKQGLVQDGHQYYAFEGKPFQAILGDVEFDVKGNDFRARDYRVRVVESPQVAGIQVRMELPAYTGLLPREVPYRDRIRIPRGSRVDFRLQANKPLARAVLSEVQDQGSVSKPSIDLAIDPEKRDTFQWAIPNLDANLERQIVLHDQDRVESQRPFVLRVSALADSPPQVKARISGVGTAITADARLPFEGPITDDFGLSRVQIELARGEDEPRAFAAAVPPDGAFQGELDLRQARALAEPLTLSEGSKVFVQVVAYDHCDLDGDPNVGRGDRYELDVVSPDQLLAMLETRELGLRQRFEQIVGEMREMRDSLARTVESADASGEDGSDPLDNPRTGRDPSDPAEPETPDALSDTRLRRMRIQRGEEHALRAQQEVLGVAQGFLDIRAELENNRIDSVERQQRLEQQIARPLEAIADPQLARLAKELAEVDQAHEGATDPLPDTSECLRLTDEVIVAMEQVLNQMLDLESYNEVLDLVRSLIRDQELLEEKTKEEQRRRVLDLLQ